MVGGWCSNRPWATNWLGTIFSTSFFDGLCSWAGYRVGQPAPVQTQLTDIPVKSNNTPVKTQPTQVPVSTTSPSIPTVPARVTIWAVPSTVTLGARTTIFWNTQSVQNCTISSPDGSFHENTLTGGGDTVPLTSATTYTISCLDYQQNPVTDYVTVPVK